MNDKFGGVSGFYLNDESNGEFFKATRKDQKERARREQQEFGQEFENWLDSINNVEDNW